MLDNPLIALTHAEVPENAPRVVEPAISIQQFKTVFR